MRKIQAKCRFRDGLGPLGFTILNSIAATAQKEFIAIRLAEFPQLQKDLETDEKRLG
jgi:hypothetical protein